MTVNKLFLIVFRLLLEKDCLAGYSGSLCQLGPSAYEFDYNDMLCEKIICEDDGCTCVCDIDAWNEDYCGKVVTSRDNSGSPSGWKDFNEYIAGEEGDNPP